MPYHHIRTLGLIFLILMQILLAALGLRVAGQTSRGIETITKSLQPRLDALHRMEQALVQAFYLYKTDSKNDFATSKEIFANVDILSTRIKIIIPLCQKPELKKNLRSIHRSIESTRQNLINILEKSKLADYNINKPKAVKTKLKQIRIQLSDIASGYAKKAGLSDLHFYLIGAISIIDQMGENLDNYLNWESIPPSDIIPFFSKALSNLAFLDDKSVHTDPKEWQHIKNLRDVLQKLQITLPQVDEMWEKDRNMLVLNNQMATIDRLWDKMLFLLNELRQCEEGIIKKRQIAILNFTNIACTQFFILAATSVIIGILFAIFISRLMNNRLQILLDGTERLTQGERDFRLEVKAKDKLGTLAKSFNNMASALAAKERELKESHGKLEHRVQERTAALSTVNKELKLMGNVFQHALEGIFVTNRHTEIIKVNPAFSTITRYQAEEVIGRETFWTLDSGYHDQAFFKTIKNRLSANGMWEGEVWKRRKSDKPFPAWLSISSMKDGTGNVFGHIGVFHDITNSKKQEEFIRHQALHDALTGLPNRILLIDRMDIAIAQARRSGKKLAVIFIDLDNFKKINDSLGHACGDLLLQAVAKKLKTFFREEDTVCRMGGDEFVAMAVNLDSENIAMELAERILESLTSPIQVKERKLFISGSIGISIFPDDGEESEILIKNADMAMYRAKQQGKNNIQLFTQKMNEMVWQRLVLEEEIRKGLTADEFTVYFQPKINIKTMQVVGMESLARWLPPQRAPITPNVFIPICEEAGLIIELGKKVLEMSCRLGKEIIEKQGNSEMHIAVNISIKQLQHDNIVEHILEVLEKTGVNPRQLELEVTETAIMVDVERTVRILNELAALGINISIDDFGTGYSSLYHLKHFPISTLKIDRSFINDIICDPNDSQIVETVIAMAKKLNLSIVAEGVETKPQLDILGRMECDMVQGYYFSPPLPPEKVMDFLSSFNSQFKLTKTA